MNPQQLFSFMLTRKQIIIQLNLGNFIGSPPQIMIIITVHCRLLSRTVGRYRRAVGCYRTKVSKTERTRSGLFKTSKISKIRPIASENGDIEKRINIFHQK